MTNDPQEDTIQTQAFLEVDTSGEGRSSMLEEGEQDQDDLLLYSGKTPTTSAASAASTASSTLLEMEVGTKSMEASGSKSTKLKLFVMHKMQPTKCLSCSVGKGGRLYVSLLRGRNRAAKVV